MATNGVELTAVQQTTDLLNKMFFGAHWPFAPHIHAVHLETNTKAQNFPEYQVQQQNTQYIWTLGDISYISLKTQVPQTSNTVPVIKPQLLPIPARSFLQKDKHSFYSRETARHPDKHLITQHLALITSNSNDTANEDTEGFGVVGASSYGSHTHSTFSRCFLRVKNKTHSTVTHHHNLTANKGCF